MGGFHFQARLAGVPAAGIPPRSLPEPGALNSAGLLTRSTPVPGRTRPGWQGSPQPRFFNPEPGSTDWPVSAPGPWAHPRFAHRAPARNSPAAAAVCGRPLGSVGRLGRAPWWREGAGAADSAL